MSDGQRLASRRSESVMIARKHILRFKAQQDCPVTDKGQKASRAFYGCYEMSELFVFLTDEIAGSANRPLSVPCSAFLALSET